MKISYIELKIGTQFNKVGTYLWNILATMITDRHFRLL